MSGTGGDRDDAGDAGVHGVRPPLSDDGCGCIRGANVTTCCNLRIVLSNFTYWNDCLVMRQQQHCSSLGNKAVFYTSFEWVNSNINPSKVFTSLSMVPFIYRS